MKDAAKNPVILSICIPTLGGSDRLETGLKRILSYQGEDIEIIISDNDSEGKLQEVIDKFSDKRLHYYANEHNYGPFYNWIKVLTYGKGKYLLTLNDNDWILNDNLPEILNFLDEEEASVIVSNARNNGGISYTEGARNGYSCTGEETHPSCFMIKKDKFCLIKDVISLKDKVQSYVQCTLALICCKNDKVCINRKIGIIEMPNQDYYISHIGRATKEITGTNGGFYYTPAGALAMLSGYIDICKTYYSVNELNRMIPYLYKAQLKRATVEYKASSTSKVMTIRYGLPYRTDINLNKERKLFYKNTKKLLLEGNYSRGVKAKVWLFTLWDKYSTDIKLMISGLEETIHYCVERYSWAKQIQKSWRVIRDKVKHKLKRSENK